MLIGQRDRALFRDKPFETWTEIEHGNLLSMTKKKKKSLHAASHGGFIRQAPQREASRVFEDRLE
jgi:hypothetical protein